MVAGLSNGDYDIAALATNVASNLYNKTNGGVQICALNTYGVLYILENGDTIQSMSDLAGKTIYATTSRRQPQYVLNYLLTENGLTPGEDVDVEFMDSETLMTQMAAGAYEVCMLPVPAVTSVLIQNQDVRVALDLTDEWNKVTDEACSPWAALWCAPSLPRRTPRPSRPSWKSMPLPSSPSSPMWTRLPAL